MSARHLYRDESENSGNSGPQRQNKTVTATFGSRKMVVSVPTQSAEQLGQYNT